MTWAFATLEVRPNTFSFRVGSHSILGGRCRLLGQIEHGKGRVVGDFMVDFQKVRQLQLITFQGGISFQDDETPAAGKVVQMKY